MNDSEWMIMDAIKFEIERLKAENARLREALETLERVSGCAMMSDDPARVKARAALEGK